MHEIIGWGSSLVLLATIITQISKQWRERSGRGVSRWLYVGQAAASLGFCIYSVLVENWVFIVTNALLTLAALVGLAITLLFRNKPASGDRHDPTPNAAHEATCLAQPGLDTRAAARGDRPESRS